MAFFYLLDTQCIVKFYDLNVSALSEYCFLFHAGSGNVDCVEISQLYECGAQNSVIYYHSIEYKGNNWLKKGN